MFSPGRAAFDGNTSSSWQLIPGASAGWVEAYGATAQRYSGASVDASIPAGVQMSISVLSNGSYVTVPGGTIYGPFNGITTLIFPGELLPTNRVLVELSGGGADQAKVYEIQWQVSGAPLPFAKILPKSYTTNFTEYINIKASRLWNKINDSDWFEPLWSLPAEPFQTDAANKPTAIFPPYQGNPPVQNGQIVWQLDGTYQIQVLKAYFINPGRWVRFEFWQNGRWTGAQDLKDSHSDGWQRLELASPVTTNQVRISFPGGWEQARYLGQVEVWGQGWSDAPSRPLVISPVDGDGYQHFTIDDLALRNYLLKAIVPGVQTANLSGQWNGAPVTLSPVAQVSGSTIYQVAIPATSIIAGQQFLKLLTSGNLTGISVDVGEDKGQVDLGSPWGNGFFDQSGSAGASPALTSKTWDLGNTYQLEKLRVYMKGANAPVFQTQLNHRRTNVSWTSQGAGWWEADLNGQTAEALLFTSSIAVAIDQIQLYGTPLEDTDVEVEIWWPQSSPTHPVTSDGHDGNSVIGWMGDPSTQPTINDWHPRQSDKIFWMPLSQMNLSPGGSYDLGLQGTLNNHTGHARNTFHWWNTPPVTLTQGVDLATTTASTLTLSGTDSIHGSLCFIGGTQVTVVGGSFSYAVPLSAGYQIIPVEIWDSQKRHLLVSLQKPVYRALGQPALAFDLPRGSLWSQGTSMQITGRVGNGPGLGLKMGGKSVALSQDAFQQTVTLSEGIQTLSYVLTDSLGRQTTANLVIYRDLTPPLISITSPKNGQYIRTSTFNMVVSGGTDAQLWWSFNNQPWQPGLLNPEVQSFTLGDGSYTYTVRGQDRSGNLSNQASVSFMVDGTPPLPFSVSANVSGWTNNNQPTITFSTTDATSGIDHYSYSVDAGALTAITSPFQLPTLNDGEHQVQVTAFDKAGNSTAASVTVQIDTAPPVAVQNLRAIPGDGTLDVVWTTTDTDIILYHVMRSPAWPDGVHDTTAAVVKETGLTNGSVYSYQVWAEDRAHNLGPQAETSQSITGLGVAAVSTSTTEPTILEYKGVTVVIPPAVLPADNVAVILKQVDSPTLREVSNYPIVSPIYSLSTLAQQPDGSLRETTHTEFAKEVVVALDYDAAQLPNGFPEANLSVYYFDTTWSKWFKVEKSAVDLGLKKIIFSTNHFSDFSVQPTMITDLSPQQLKDIGHSPVKSESASGAVTVSPQGGTAMTEVTDFVLQGQNGFTLPIKRIYDTGTAISDSPSLSLSASLSFNDVTDLINIAGIAAQLVSQGVSGMVGSIQSKIVSMVKQNGDYGLATGVGWRLNFPYVTTNNTSVSVRLPTGGYYNINQMQSHNSFWTSNPVNRTLDFEMHEGEDFYFRVTQVRSDVTDVTSFISGQVSSAITSAILGKTGGGGPSGSSIISMAASLIPGWSTISSELWTKDGTYYLFDGSGRIVEIKDKSGFNTFRFHYAGLLLHDVTDDLGRQILFQYNDSGVGAAFARPVITKIWTTGFQNHDGGNAPGPLGDTTRTVNFTYNWSAAGSSGTFFNFLPTLTSTVDPLGRQFAYSYDQRSLVTGGGAIKINFLALLLDLCGASMVSDFLGISALTLSGHLEINLPYVISRVVAPGIGTTDVHVGSEDLSQFDFRPTDYFLGLFPTALEISYEILFRLATEAVTVTSSTGVVRQTRYTYRWSSSDHQYYVSQSTVDDGRTQTLHNFSPYGVTRYRYISWDDYLLGVARQLFQQQGYTISELFSLESGLVTTDNSSGRLLEYVSNTWDTGYHRILVSTVTRGASTYDRETYQYDTWGNQTYILSDRFSNGSQQRSEQWNWYLNSGSAVPSVWSIAHLGTDEALNNQNVRNLLKGTLIRSYRPGVAGGGFEEIDQEVVYNAYGLKKAEGLWLDDHWAATSYTYFTDPALLSAGFLQTRTGPKAGQLTTWSYDYTSFPQSMYTVSETTQNVTDPSGAVTSLTKETAFDWISGWKLYDKDARGYLVEYSYDKLNRPTDVLRTGDEGPLAAGAWTVLHTNAPWEHYAYNDTALTVTVSKGIYPSASLKVYELDSYDSLGQLIRIDKYNTLGPSGTQMVSLPQVQTTTTLATYSPWGDVASMTDPNGNKTQYAYDARSRLALVTHADGTTVRTAYDDSQNLKTTTNERGIITQEWLTWKDQTQMKVEDIGTLGITTQTYYDGLDQVAAQVDALNQVTITFYSPFGKPSDVLHPSVGVWESPSEPLSSVAGGFTTKTVLPEDVFTFDDAGQVVRQQTGYQGNWHQIDQVYDTAGRVIKKALGAPGGETREEWSWYDENGNLVKHADALQVTQIKSGQADSNGASGFSTKTYSSRNKVLTETDPLGAVVRYQYDFLDRKVQMKDPRANPTGTDNFTINYAYNDLDRLSLADLPPVTGQGRGNVTITYDLRGNAVSQVDPSGKTTTWTYDTRNRKTSQSVMGADGTGPLLNAWGYDAAGNTTAETLASSINASDPGASAGLLTAKFYDNLNRLAETDLPDGQKQITSFDALGRAIEVRDALNNTTHNTYNSLNKITLTTDPKGNNTNLYYDVWADVTATQIQNSVNGDQIWVRSFNPYSQVLYEENNAAQLWSYTYDPRGLVTGATDPNGTTTANTYTLTGLLTGKTLTRGSQTQVQSWSYDTAGSLMSATDGGVSTAINQAGGSFAPDPYDLVNSYTTSLGSKSLSLAYTYDKAHNPLSLTYPDGSTITFQYNGLEELTGIPGYAANGQYNFMGRLTSLQAPDGTKRTKTWNATEGTLDDYSWNISGKTSRVLGWDTRGNLVRQSKDGSDSSYVYDQLNRLMFAQEGGKIETLTDSSMPQGSQQRDVAGAKGLDFTSPGATVKLDYYSSSIGVNLNSLQNISKVRLIGVSPRIQPRTVEVYLSSSGVNGSWTKLTDMTWLQDQTGVTLQLSSPHQGQFVKLHMTWDERDQNNQPVDHHTLAGTVAQLVQVWYIVNGQTTSWTYDSLGNRIVENRTRANSVATNYSYYLNTSRIKQAGSWAFNYDANGNLTSRGMSAIWDSASSQYTWSAESGELYSYSYDLKNRLVSVQHGLAGSASLQVVAQYTYDIRDLRVLTVKPAATTYTQYDQSGDLLWHDDGTTTVKYVEALGQIWAEVRTTGTTSLVYFHHTDHEGSTNVITDSTGTVVWDGDFEAFGSLIRANGTMAFDASYTGKEFDADTGLYYSNARWYDPTLGRFITEDPARDGDNWFAYVSNNPLAYIDPTGLDKTLAEAMQATASDMMKTVRVGSEYFRGAGRGFVKAAKGTLDTVRHPLRSAKAAWSALTHPADTAKAIAQNVKQRVQAFTSADAEGKAGMVGEIGGENAFGIATTVAAAKGTELVGDLVKAGKAASATDELTYLYQKVGPEGEHLKYGTTKGPATRYSQEELAGGELKIVASGSKQEMLRLERDVHSTLPIGPEEGQKTYINIQAQKGLSIPPYEK